MKYTGMNHTCKACINMSRTSVTPPALESWRRSGLNAGTQQYVSLVRVFLNKRKRSEIASVDEDELVSYCLGLRSKGMCEKVARALAAFFAHQFRSGAITTNPAFDLKERIKRDIASAALLKRLMSAGMTRADARALRWRDVAGVAFKTVAPGSRVRRLPARDAPIMQELSKRLLSQMRFVELNDIDALLDQQLC